MINVAVEVFKELCLSQLVRMRDVQTGIVCYLDKTYLWDFWGFLNYHLQRIRNPLSFHY